MVLLCRRSTPSAMLAPENACSLGVFGDFRQIRRFRNHLSLCSIRKTVPALLARFCITSWLCATYTNKLFAPEPRPNRGPARPRHQHKPTQQNRPFCAPQAKPAGGTFFPAAGGRPAPTAHLISSPLQTKQMVLLRRRFTPSALLSLAKGFATF